MSETVEADLLIELNIECPNCGKYFDLMKYKDLNEEGGIIKRACPDGYWGDEHNKFKEDVDCPTCEHKIQVRGIVW